MPKYLIEVHMPDAGQPEVERVLRLLEVAQARRPVDESAASTLMAGVSREDGRLVCLVEATSLEAVRGLLGLALLPHGRIREITNLASVDLGGGRHPRGDVHPRVEAELVEDVVDVGLDRPLREE